MKCPPGAASFLESPEILINIKIPNSASISEVSEIS